MRIRDFGFFFAAGLFIAWLGANFQQSPGYMDAEYYFLGGRQLATGAGFSDPVLWNYLDSPEGIPHPANSYWMPLASVLAAAGQWITGVNNFLSARLGFLLLAGLVSPVTALLGYSLTGSRRNALFSGILALFPMFYLPYLGTTDTFALSMVIGGLFLSLVGLLIQGRNSSSRLVRAYPLLLGLLAGSMHLARADGMIWLAGGAAAIILAGGHPGSSDEPGDGWRGTGRRLSLLGVGYFLVMGPWLLRNLSEFGTLLSPGGMRTLWLTGYNELFSYPADSLTFQHWIASGLGEILRVRLSAFGSNLTHAFAVQGQIFLAPFMLAGLWKLRKALQIQVGLLVWLATFLAMTVAFPFPGVRGGLFHSGASVQTLLWACVPVGFEAFIELGRRGRGWKPGQAYTILAAGMVVLGAVATGLIFYNRVIGTDSSQSNWDGPGRRYLQVEESLWDAGVPPSDPVLVNNPVGYYLASERPALAIPDTELEGVRQAAAQYGARYLVLESDHPDGLAHLFQNPVSLPGIEFIGSAAGSHIFRISPSVAQGE